MLFPFLFFCFLIHWLRFTSIVSIERVKSHITNNKKKQRKTINNTHTNKNKNRHYSKIMESIFLDNGNICGCFKHCASCVHIYVGQTMVFWFKNISYFFVSFWIRHYFCLSNLTIRFFICLFFLFFIFVAKPNKNNIFEFYACFFIYCDLLEQAFGKNSEDAYPKCVFTFLYAC